MNSNNTANPNASLSQLCTTATQQMKLGANSNIVESAIPISNSTDDVGCDNENFGTDETNKTVEGTNMEEVMLFSTPPTNRPLDNSGSSIPVGDQESSAIMEHVGTTPAITKLKQMRKEFQVSSPSDQLMSPCTRKLEKCRFGGVAFSHPQHILRTRQHEGVQLAKSSSGGSSQTCTSSVSPSNSSGSSVEPVPLAEPFDGDNGASEFPMGEEEEAHTLPSTQDQLMSP